MNSKIFDSRSFNSNFTRSDHKPVTAKIQIKWTYMKRSLNLSKLQNKQIAKNYMKQVNEIMKNQTSTTQTRENGTKL